MPYISGNYAALYEFISRQNQWFQYGDRVWVNHIGYVSQCTSFAFSSVDITDCNQKNSFICEIGELTNKILSIRILSESVRTLFRLES